MDATVGRRERKKAATRQTLHEVALRLAAEQGLDRVTVEAIADAADVSRRTFSNYFANKEEALFHADLVRIRRLLDLVRARPTNERPWTALSRAGEELAAGSDYLDPQWLAQRRLIRAHPSLAAHQITVYGTVERELTAEISRRLPESPDSGLRSRVLAAAFLNALRAATQHWIDHPDRPLAELVHDALTYLADR
ncbi:TetR family transcriptional regulator [Plantactinospora sp. S1510]|uniref:TetR family transcriptional regulator n=1 Tax=Plantactinospora alkalitolerans TaxID=2789879 RepID=A0ABS0GYY2_9ACTN|nr:TetR family transcriptional regulator [Plantactinospora alkalitolerans]MBF9131419.1 TetR family transcriptional regulator [Plantactinospora alkalitolerans]